MRSKVFAGHGGGEFVRRKYICDGFLVVSSLSSFLRPGIDGDAGVLLSEFWESRKLESANISGATANRVKSPRELQFSLQSDRLEACLLA